MELDQIKVLNLKRDTLVEVLWKDDGGREI